MENGRFEILSTGLEYIYNKAPEIKDVPATPIDYYKGTLLEIPKSIKVEDYPTYRHYLSSKFFDILSKYTVGYGEKPWNILIVSIATISIFALLYMFIGIKTLNNEFTYVVKDIFEVNPEDTFVLDQDNEIKELTIVTCTNKGKDRLIVKAEIVEDKNNK